MKIDRHMKISDILNAFPRAVEIFLDADLQCTGCGANTLETLDEGMKKHSRSEEQIEEMEKKLNVAFSEFKEDIAKNNKERVGVEDLNVIEVLEGNKRYYKVAGLLFSQKAYDALHELKEKPGFQIKMEAGGCSGYSYKYDYKDEPEQEEAICKLSENLNIYIDDHTFSKLHGSIVDFETGLKGSGLVFHNPNIKRSCHCGSSVGF